MDRYHLGSQIPWMFAAREEWWQRFGGEISPANRAEGDIGDPFSAYSHLFEFYAQKYRVIWIFIGCGTDNSCKSVAEILEDRDPGGAAAHFIPSAGIF
nr:hypothetical protein [uncultured Oscillibacter sp.]